MGNPEYLCGDKYLNNLCSLLELYNYKQCSLFLCLTSRCDPPATFMLQTFVTASSAWELSLAKSRNLCASRPVSSFVAWNEANDRSRIVFLATFGFASPCQQLLDSTIVVFAHTPHHIKVFALTPHHNHSLHLVRPIELDVSENIALLVNT